ncbi:hypothetical protein [Ferrimonas pelagia]|uniref:Tetratricopeptide repeat protein n=1 Tax=Ferrimonas pelagia TaxID=1177826 RepID=A0ABP9FHL2_9GAMM
MSVINQTLQRLERAGRRGIPAQIPRVSVPAKRTRSWRWALAAGLLLLLLGIWWPLLPWSTPPQSASMTASVSAEAVADTTVEHTAKPITMPAVSAPEAPLEQPLAKAPEPMTASVDEAQGASVSGVAEAISPPADTSGTRAPIAARGASAPMTTAAQAEINAATLVEPEPVADAAVEPVARAQSAISPEPSSPSRSEPAWQAQPSALTPTQQAAQLWQQDPQAPDALRQLLQWDPSHHPARLRYVDTLAGAAQRQALQAAIERFPQQAGYRVRLAQHEWHRSERALAQQALLASQALALEPVWRSQRASLAQQLELHELASSDWQLLLQQQPLQGHWWLGLGFSLEYLQRYQPAIQAYRAAMADTRLDADAIEYARRRIAALGEQG